MPIGYGTLYLESCGPFVFHALVGFFRFVTPHVGGGHDATMYRVWASILPFALPYDGA